ncbi:MAG TPA: C39 family peptidase [Thermomicrobiales bacterium]|nr:C39 family peptidase [Thermomicrobiales bacterium]
MPRRFASFAMALAVVLAGCAALVPGAIAQTSATVWVEFDTVEPGIGCVVDVSIDGRAALAGASISLVVSDDSSGAIISSDSDIANSSGIVWLVIDTNGGYAGAKAWAAVNVNGQYLSGQSIWITEDGGCSGGTRLVTMSGTVPSTSSGSSSSSDASGAVVIPGAFGYQQERGLSCEYAALAIATGMLGDWVSEYDFESVVPLNDNPHWGYRGYIDGGWGGTGDYGIYAAPLVPALQTFGFQGVEFYGDRWELMAHLDLGRPTLVWIGARGDAGTFNEYTADGTRFQLTPYMHVVVVYGYDDGGVYVSDPGNGSLDWWDWSSFEAMWSVMDGMSLAVHW